MSVSPDLAAATHGGDSVTQSNEDLEYLRQLAAEAGHRLVPMAQGELAAAEQTDPDTISGKIKRLAWLDAAATAAERQAKSFTAEAEQLKLALAEQMVEEDVKRTTSAGRTAYFASTYKLRKVSDDITTAEVLEALRESGQGNMIKDGYNHATVQSYLKELHKEGLEVPAALAKVFVLDVGSEVRMRRSGA